MAQPYIGEIRMFGGNFAPVGWMFCEGQLLPIATNDALYALIGTTYGGDGQTTFALPDLRGRSPMHVDASNPPGVGGGVESVTLTIGQMPLHTHTALAVEAPGNQRGPEGNAWAAESGNQTATYLADAPTGNMNVQAISAVGGSQPHENMPPFLCINFIIAVEGIFPPRS